MTIYRTVFQVEVFSDGPYVASHRDDDPFGLKDIDYSISEGDCIGNVEEISSEEVPTDKIEAELVRIGNDGTFFERDNGD